MMNHKRWFGAAMLLFLVLLGGALLSRPAAIPQESAADRAALADNAGLTGPQRDQFIAGEVESGEENEMAAMLSMEEYWLQRTTYPTGNFDPRWVAEARQQDARVQRGVPAGERIYNKGENPESPLTLDPNAFTFLGPRPEQSNGCLNCFSYGPVAGRTNDILIDPTNTATVYIASDGGGVWKSTDCCTTTTTWTPMTDDSALQGIAIGTMAMDPNNPQIIYGGTGDLRYGGFSFGSSGLLKSTNGGATWTIKGANVFVPGLNVTGYPEYQSIGAVKVDPNNSNNLIVGTKTGFYISNDGGDNWSPSCYTNPHATQRQDITDIVVYDAGATTTVYVAVGTRGVPSVVIPSYGNNGANGIYRATWPAAGCPAVADWTLLTRPDNGWPAGTGSGIPMTTTGGNILGRINFTQAPSDPNTLYAIVQATLTNAAAGVTAFGPLGIWGTNDGGASWTQRMTPADLTGCSTDPGTQNWYNQEIAVDPNNRDVVWADMIDIWRSTNGADTFENITCGYSSPDKDVHVDQHQLAFRPGSSSELMASNDGGIYFTSNATAAQPSITFTQLNTTYGSIEFYGGDITANFATAANVGVNAGAQDNGSSVCATPNCTPGPTAMWQLRKGGDGMFARIEPVLGQRWYQESQNGSLAVTTAGPYSGQSSITGGWSSSSERKSFVFPYEIYKHGALDVPGSGCTSTAGCTHLIAGSYRIWENIVGTGGGNWYINSPDLTKNLTTRSYINQLAYSFTDPKIAVVGTSDGNVQYGFNLGAGTANTATWVNVTGGNSVLPNRPILDVVTSDNPLVSYVAVGGFDQNTPSTPGHLFQVTCTANCASFTWVNKSGNLPNIPIDSVMINPRYPQTVFAGSDWGLYFTNDINAATPVWQRFTAGLPNVMIWDMSVDRGYTTLALFTRSRGAYAWPLPNGPIGGPTVTPSPTSPATATATPTRTPTATATATATPPIRLLYLPLVLK